MLVGQWVQMKWFSFFSILFNLKNINLGLFKGRHLHEDYKKKYIRKLNKNEDKQ